MKFEPSAQQLIPSEFSAGESHAIAEVAERECWQVAAHDVMRGYSQRAYRLAVDEYGAQLRFLLPLTPESRVLQLRCDWGAVAMSLTTCTASVVTMDNRLTRLRFVNARRRQAGASLPHTVCGNASPTLPFRSSVFDAVIMLDALESLPVARQELRAAQRRALDEGRRVLRPGGWLLVGAVNRLGFPRPESLERRDPRTYFGYQQALRQAGFQDLEFHAPLPSVREPFFILPLDQLSLVDHFVQGIFSAQDYRSKLEARGLGPAFRLAHDLWGLGRRLGLTGLARYVVPSFLIVAHR